jgi:cytosine/adenosine deaminase-related metal-dependent hydrolase
VRKYLENGVLPALGTDSLASNPELSLWREMQVLAEEHEGVDAAAIFAMATRGGAEALGLGDRLGTLESGKDADLLAVPIPGYVSTASQIYDYLVTTGRALQPVRLEH